MLLVPSSFPRYIRDSSIGTASTGNELKFYDATGAGWLLRHDGNIDCRQFGINGDGTNETVKVQLWLDSCASSKASALIPANLTVSVVGLVLNSAHDWLKFDIKGWFKFFGTGSAPVNAPANVTGGACFAMYLNGVYGLSGLIKFDGDRSTKIFSEQIHCIGMYGGIDNNLTLMFRECRGDGVYVNHYKANVATDPGTDPIATHNFPTRLSLHVSSSNSDYDGRNAVSLIAYKECTVSGISTKHGNGKASGAASIGFQPGGLDVEPNMYWQSCYNLIVPSWISDAAGWSGGFSLVGKVNGGDPLDVNIRGVTAKLELTTVPSSSGGTCNGMALQYARDINIQGTSRYVSNPVFSTGFYNGLMMTGCSNFSVDINVFRAANTAMISIEDAVSQGVTRCQNGALTIRGTHVGNGVMVGDVDNINLDLKFDTMVSMGGGGDRGLLQFRQSYVSGAYQSNTTVQNSKFSVSIGGGISFITPLNFGIRVHPTYPVTLPVLSNIIDNSDLNNITHNTSSNQNRMAGTAGFIKGKILGVTIKDGDDPIVGSNVWGAGDVIWNKSSSATYVGKRYSGSSWQNFGPLS